MLSPRPSGTWNRSHILKVVMQYVDSIDWNDYWQVVGLKLRFTCREQQSKQAPALGVWVKRLDLSETFQLYEVWIANPKVAGKCQNLPRSEPVSEPR